jgi:hypothetical protein
MLDALKIAVTLNGQDKLVFSGADSITVTGQNAYNKHIKVTDPRLNTLPSGDYFVVFRDLRDAIGNFADAGGKKPYQFEVKIQ